MISGERIKRTKHVPSCAKDIGGISIESTDIRSHEGKTKEIVTVDSIDRKLHIVNIRPIITHPMVGIFTNTREIRASENIRSLFL